MKKFFQNLIVKLKNNKKIIVSFFIGILVFSFLAFVGNEIKTKIIYFKNIDGEYNLPKNKDGKIPNIFILNLITKNISTVTNENDDYEIQKKIIKYSEKYGVYEVSQYFNLNFIIYQDENEIIDLKKITNELLGIGQNYVYIKNDTETAKTLLRNNKFSKDYQSFPIVIFNKYNPGAAEILKKDKENSEEKENFINLSNKYQYFGNTYILSDNILKDLNIYCNSNGSIINNGDYKNTFILIGLNSTNNFYKNIKGFYSINANFCFIPIQNEKLLFAPNLDFKLKNPILFQSENNFPNSFSKTLADFFYKKEGIYYLNEKNLLKIDNFENFLKSIKL